MISCFFSLSHILLQPPTLDVARFYPILSGLISSKKIPFPYHLYRSLPAIRALPHPCPCTHPPPLLIYHDIILLMLPSLLTERPKSRKHLPFISCLPGGAKHGADQRWTGPVYPPDSCMTKLLVNRALSTTLLPLLFLVG